MQRNKLKEKKMWWSQLEYLSSFIILEKYCKNQQKQCTITGEIPQNHQTFALFAPPTNRYLKVKIDGLPIPKGGLVKGPYQPICRDCAIYFSITVIFWPLSYKPVFGLIFVGPRFSGRGRSRGISKHPDSKIIQGQEGGSQQSLHWKGTKNWRYWWWFRNPKQPPGM